MGPWKVKQEMPEKNFSVLDVVAVGKRKWIAAK
jgi:hypothetical protein